MTVIDEGEHEKQVVEDLLAATPPIAGIESVKVELGEDHAGDPSLWLVFTMRPDLQADTGWIQAYSEYTTKLSLKILQAGLLRFPYTRLERAA